MNQSTVDPVPTWAWVLLASPVALFVLGAMLDTAALSGFGVIFGFIGYLWIVPIWLGHRIMKKKGRSPGAGVALGFLLGWIGVLIAACLSTDPVLALRLSRQEEGGL